MGYKTYKPFFLFLLYTVILTLYGVSSIVYFSIYIKGTNFTDVVWAFVFFDHFSLGWSVISDLLLIQFSLMLGVFALAMFYMVGNNILTNISLIDAVKALHSRRSGVK